MKMSKCKSCGTDVSATSGAVCPNCGRLFKKPVYQRVWFIVLAVFIGLGFLGGMMDSDDEKENISESNAVAEENQTVATEQEVVSEPVEQEVVSEPVVEYTKVSVQEMLDTLDANALKAETVYQDMYIELTGDLNNIDSDGKYITLVPVGDEYCFRGVNCMLTNDEQKAIVLEKTKGDTMTLKGKVTSIGEVLGYSLDIKSIS